jgi:hypothetical protein
LHRLLLLGVAWGSLERVQGKLGTFHEVWNLQWEPEFAVEVIASAPWGNTVASAASAKTRRRAADATELPELTALIEPVLKADLPDAAQPVLDRLREIAAVAPDVAHLMAAIPPLARVSRYGDVRQTDRSVVEQAVREVAARICVGLPVACGSLNDDAAAAMLVHVGAVHQSLSILDNAEIRGPWCETLRRVADLPNLHGLVGGRCCRLLFDSAEMTVDEAAQRASQSLSPGIDPAMGAQWIEGFLEKSGAVLMVNDTLWNLVDNWVQELSADAFPNVLPLLRRTFATFPAGERRQLGERVREGSSPSRRPAAVLEIDQARASQSLPLLAAILGLKLEKTDAD